MKWVKKNPELKTLAEVIEANVDMPLDEFLHPQNKTYSINGLDTASNMILTAIHANQHIHIIGDYDTDGVMASAIVEAAIRECGGKDVTVRLPKRFSEGYGLSTSIVEEVNSGLLITVDNGITAHEAIQVARDKGLTVLVIDHHLPAADSELPEANLIIDPNAIPESATFNGYCGAGLAYKLAQYMLGNTSRVLPRLLSMAAIATVADVMVLKEDNRMIVQDGLNSMVQYAGRTTGLGALLELCGMDRYVSAKNIGFKIAPILNAAGRMYDDGAMMAYKLVSFNGPFSEAQIMAQELYDLNEVRKKEKTEGLVKLHKNINDNCLYGDAPLCVYEPGLMEGLVGIFAGNLAEEYHVPCIVFTDSEEPGILKGSGRSYGGVHLKNLLDANADILYKYGGHAEAAGVSVRADDYDTMVMRLMDSLDMPAIDTDTIEYDLDISAKDIPQVILELGKYAPFGEGNPEVVFRIHDFSLTPSATGFYKTMGEDKNHIKLFGQTCSALGFGMTEDYIKMGAPRTLNVVGMLSQNYFMGKFSNQVEMLAFENAKTSMPKTDMAALLARTAAHRYE